MFLRQVMMQILLPPFFTKLHVLKEGVLENSTRNAGTGTPKNANCSPKVLISLDLHN